MKKLFKHLPFLFLALASCRSGSVNVVPTKTIPQSQDAPDGGSSHGSAPQGSLGQQTVFFSDVRIPFEEEDMLLYGIGYAPADSKDPDNSANFPLEPSHRTTAMLSAWGDGVSYLRPSDSELNTLQFTSINVLGVLDLFHSHAPVTKLKTSATAQWMGLLDTNGSLLILSQSQAPGQLTLPNFHVLDFQFIHNDRLAVSGSAPGSAKRVIRIYALSDLSHAALEISGDQFSVSPSGNLVALLTSVGGKPALVVRPLQEASVASVGLTNLSESFSSVRKGPAKKGKEPKQSEHPQKIDPPSVKQDHNAKVIASGGSYSQVKWGTETLLSYVDTKGSQATLKLADLNRQASITVGVFRIAASLVATLGCPTWMNKTLFFGDTLQTKDESGPNSYMIYKANSSTGWKPAHFANRPSLAESYVCPVTPDIEQSARSLAEPL